MQTVSILTFNTGLARVRLGPLHYDLVPKVEKRIELICDHLRTQQADIVCLQEVFECAHEKKLRAALIDLYPHYYFSPKPAFFFGKGFAVLSKFPLKYVETVDFPVLGFDRVTEKGAAIFTMTEGPWCDVYITNVHFPYGGYGLSSLSSDRIIKLRDRCSDLLNKTLQHYSNKHVLVGDFNFGSDISPSNYSNLTKLGYVDLTKGLTSWDAANTLNTLFKISESKSLDHIFASDELMESISLDAAELVFDTAVKIEGEDTHLSDHFGVLAKVTMNHS